jgi:hypothetical protein
MADIHFLGVFMSLLPEIGPKFSVAAKWQERGCRVKRRSDKEKTVALLRKQRFLFGGGIQA